MKSKVTIGLPAYKTDFLEDAINSVLTQTFTEFELLILNDNPQSDELKKILSQFEDKRIRIIENKENIGRKNIVDCWNKLLNETNTEFFVLFSDDDLYKPFFLEELFNLSQIHRDTNLFHCRVQIIDENNKVLYVSSTVPEKESHIDFIWHKIKNYRFSYVGDFMVRTSELKAIGGFVEIPNAWGSDDLTWFKVALNGGVAGTSKILFSWRESGVNISKIGNIEQRFTAINLFFEKLKKVLNDLKPANKTDEVLLEEIRKNIFTRKFTLEGYTLKQIGNKSYLDIFRIIFLWIKIKLNFDVSFNALVWGILLILKDLKQK